MPVLAPTRRPMVLVVGGGYAVLAATTAPLTAPAAVAVAVPAGVVLALAFRRLPAGREPARADEPLDVDGSRAAARRRTTGAWTAVVALLLAVEAVALARQPALDVASPDSPTLSLLLDPVTEPWPFRLVAWGCWLAVGWALVSR